MSKVKIRCYHCSKCNNNVYIQTDQKYETICKMCKNEMELLWEDDYKPNRGLAAIKEYKVSKLKPKEVEKEKITVSCPYCQSTNTNKISKTSKLIHTAVFGIFSLSRNSKYFHCNNCGSDF